MLKVMRFHAAFVVDFHSGAMTPSLAVRKKIRSA
jgi:hypothetical protein